MDKAKLQNAIIAHQAGDIQLAKKIYEELLNTEPDNTEVLHLSGLLTAQTGQFEQALTYLQRAIKVNSGVALYHNTLGNILKELKQFSTAEEHYKHALVLDPAYNEAHNNLAGLYYLQNKLAQAEQHYQAAIHLQADYLEAHCNLGLLYIKQEKITEAIHQFEIAISLEPKLMLAHWQLANLALKQEDIARAIEHYQVFLKEYPQHAESLNNLGVAYLKAQQIDKAIDYFTKALHNEPKHLEARNNLAALYLQQNDFKNAVWHYQLYLQLKPNDLDAHYNSGVAKMASGLLEEAIQHFKRVISHYPDNANALCNLGAIYLKQGDKKQALFYYQQAANYLPNNAGIHYLISALTQIGQIPLAAPADYIKNLFDNYAEYFDRHLIETLNYQTPDLLYQALKNYLPTSPAWKVLDLGCGTGLASVKLRSIASHLIGIDISAGMLAKAREKNTYDELIETDIISFLTQSVARYDLIIAVDTLVYFGDLTNLFGLIKNSLSAAGIFAFSIETALDNNYQLNMTGRYAHHQNYISALAKQHRFKILFSQPVSGREQQGEAVAGQLFILQHDEIPEAS